MISERTGMPTPRLVRLVTGFAAAISIAIALTLPAVHFWSAWRREFAAVNAEATLAAAGVSALASRTPGLWEYQEHRLQGLLAIGAEKGRRRVLNVDGAVIAEVVVRPRESGLEVTAAAPVFDGGRQVG